MNDQMLRELMDRLRDEQRQAIERQEADRQLARDANQAILREAESRRAVRAGVKHCVEWIVALIVAAIAVVVVAISVDSMTGGLTGGAIGAILFIGLALTSVIAAIRLW